MRDVDLAYLAGIVDADGMISVQRSLRPQRMYYAARVGITGAARAPHDLAAGLFGGNVRSCVIRPGTRPQFVWMLHGTRAVPVLRALAPFLRVKREQAAVALAVQAVLAEGYDGARLHELRAECSALNFRSRPSLDWTPAAAGETIVA